MVAQEVEVEKRSSEVAKSEKQFYNNPPFLYIAN
jgi:hypothetical protein